MFVAPEQLGCAARPSASTAGKDDCRAQCAPCAITMRRRRHLMRPHWVRSPAACATAAHVVRYPDGRATAKLSQLTIMTCVSRATTAAYSAAAPRGPPPKRLGSARVGARAHRVSVLQDPREGVRARAPAQLFACACARTLAHRCAQARAAPVLACACPGARSSAHLVAFARARACARCLCGWMRACVPLPARARACTRAHECERARERARVRLWRRQAGEVAVAAAHAQVLAGSAGGGGAGAAGGGPGGGAGGGGGARRRARRGAARQRGGGIGSNVCTAISSWHSACAAGEGGWGRHIATKFPLFPRGFKRGRKGWREGERMEGRKGGREGGREGGGKGRERGTSAYEDAFNEQPSAHTKKSCQ